MKRREWMVMAGAAAVVGCGKRNVSRNFAPSTTAHANPERGFYVQRAAEQPGDLAGLLDNGISLVLLTLDLRHYRNRELDDAKLFILDEAFRKIRSSGVKVIFRAAYGFTDSDYRVDPSDLTLIQKHIASISRVLELHAPWLFAVHVGMLGPWGEWHGSTHGNPPSLQSRMAVMQAWLRHLPPHVFLQVRRPSFLRDMNADLKRVGFHNDALLAMPDDMGTYADPGWDRTRELEWCGKSLANVPNGGETVPDSLNTSPRQVLDELAKLHWTYLNSGYHEGTLSRWNKETVDDVSLLESVRQKLGYRIVPVRFGMDGKLATLELRNDGFAAPMTLRNLSFGWFDPRKQAVTENIDLPGIDCRDWSPRSPIRLSFPIPQSPDGASVPAIRVADPSEALALDGRHAIRLSSANVRFVEDGGWNLLG